MSAGTSVHCVLLSSTQYVCVSSPLFLGFWGEEKWLLGWLCACAAMLMQKSVEA